MPKNSTNMTFIIDIKNTQHQSWQGEVTWVQGNKKQYFRSALELVRLVDSVIPQGDETDESDQ